MLLEGNTPSLIDWGCAHRMADDAAPCAVLSSRDGIGVEYWLSASFAKTVMKRAVLNYRYSPLDDLYSLSYVYFALLSA